MVKPHEDPDPSKAILANTYEAKHFSDAKKSARSLIWRFSEYGVDEGDRTLDNGSHNPVLYQLSYAHHFASARNSNIFLAWLHSALERSEA